MKRTRATNLKDMKSEFIRVRVTKEQKEKIGALAEHYDMSVSELMLHIINKELNQKELNQN